MPYAVSHLKFLLLLFYQPDSYLHLKYPSSSHLTPPPHRDSFGNVLDLLDDLFERASLADVSERTPCHADNDSYINSLFANLIMWY